MTFLWTQGVKGLNKNNLNYPREHCLQLFYSDKKITSSQTHSKEHVVLRMYKLKKKLSLFITSYIFCRRNHVIWKSSLTLGHLFLRIAFRGKASVTWLGLKIEKNCFWWYLAVLRNLLRVNISKMSSSILHCFLKPIVHVVLHQRYGK